jgi:predicted enzyme related to lactoylglutathione lyase
MGNPIVHFEIMGADGKELADFYRSVFEWNPIPTEGFDGYWTMTGEDVGGTGGAVGKGGDEMPTYVALYLGVDSIDEHLPRIEAAGGTTVVPKTVLPGVVTFAMFRDPAGNVMGLAENEMPAAE